MAVTLTIKQVPEAIAARLRQRAADNHRSLQGELMALIERAALADAAADQSTASAVDLREPSAPPYLADKSSRKRGPVRKQRGDEAAASAGGDSKRLNLAELWARAKRVGQPGSSESAAIIRRLRDDRQRR